MPREVGEKLEEAVNNPTIALCKNNYFLPVPGTNDVVCCLTYREPVKGYSGNEVRSHVKKVLENYIYIRISLNNIQEIDHIQLEEWSDLMEGKNGKLMKEPPESIQTIMNSYRGQCTPEILNEIWRKIREAAIKEATQV